MSALTSPPQPQPFAFTPRTASSFILEVLIPTLENSVPRVAASGPTCEAKRKDLLTLQVEVVEAYTSAEGGDPATGIQAFKSILHLASSDAGVACAVKRMNEALRETYILSLLAGRRPNHDLKASGSMLRSEVVDFLDGCVGLVSLESTREKLRASRLETGKIPRGLLLEMQDEILEGVGIEKDFGAVELNQIRVRYASDVELLSKVEEFTAQMEKSLKEFIGNATDHAGGTDAVRGDGTTRVVSVSHTSTVDPAVPKAQVNKEREEGKQRADFAMAKRAANLQQDILAELLSLEVDERREMLEEARVTHETVIRQVMELKDFGERAQFMQLLSPDSQRRMICHKMWEQMVQQNGGVEPVIERSEKGGAFVGSGERDED